MNLRLGNFQKVDDLKSIWPNGKDDFLKWLCEGSNIGAVGYALGMDLKIELVSNNAGEHFADIICQGNNSSIKNIPVLVSAKIDLSQDQDLSKMLESLDEVEEGLIVWIAAPLSEGHRKALHKLNGMTKENLLFFGIEVGLWRIGDSDPALWMDVVSKPENWRDHPSTAHMAQTEQNQQNAPQNTPNYTVVPNYTPPSSGSGGYHASHVQPQASQPQAPQPHAQAQPQLDAASLIPTYWQSFQKMMDEKDSFIKSPADANNNRPWMVFDIGSPHFSFFVSANQKENALQVLLICHGPNAEKNYAFLYDIREKIEWELGMKLTWKHDAKRKEGRMGVEKKDIVIRDAASWQEQHQWILETLEKFEHVFRSHIRMLEAPQKPDGDNSTIIG